jgi:Flp pilus assembly protein TadG
MVEFALLLPLFLLIIGGIVDGGRAFFRQIELTNAAREGARAAVVSTATIAQIQSRAQAAAPGIVITVDPVVLCAGPGTNAEVTTSIDFEWYFLGPALALVGGSNNMPSTLDSKAVMRCGG